VLRERDELLRRNSLLEQEVQRLSAEAGVVNFAKLQALEEEVEETRSLNATHGGRAEKGEPATHGSSSGVSWRVYPKE
jgi:hypothetical protein